MHNTTSAKPVTYGAYSLVVGLVSGRLIIQRQDADRRRTVAFVDTLSEWDRFVAALKAGSGEAEAVHAIDGAPS